MAADAGHEVSLSCDVDSNPEPRVTWVKRDCQACQRVSAVWFAMEFTDDKQCRMVQTRLPS